MLGRFVKYYLEVFIVEQKAPEVYSVITKALRGFVSMPHLTPQKS
jgi:hypothetical protein